MNKNEIFQYKIIQEVDNSSKAARTTFLSCELNKINFILEGETSF